MRQKLEITTLTFDILSQQVFWFLEISEPCVGYSTYPCLSKQVVGTYCEILHEPRALLNHVECRECSSILALVEEPTID